MASAARDRQIVQDITARLHQRETAILDVGTGARRPSSTNCLTQATDG